MNNQLEKVTIRGFKTIRSLENFEPGQLTALIGPNGSGKSNFISFFRMMSWALAGPDNLAFFVGERGGASRILHNGPAQTREIEAELSIRTQSGNNQYAFRLFYAADDRLVFAEERYRLTPKGDPPRDWRGTGAGHSSPGLIPAADTDTTARVIRRLLQRIIVHQFHNTSDTSRIRGSWSASDNRFLKEDGANVAPVLFRLRENDGNSYRRIVDTIRLVLPFFSDFELEPEYGNLLLRWREQNTDQVFSASQASDGMLRVVTLVTLLLQPVSDLPDVLILDEPELGLHPYAINIVGGLINAASKTTQVMVATQSMALLDCFNPEDVVVVDRGDGGSEFKRLSSKALDSWLEEYSLSELWEKNVIGGRP